jgi:hypothetical protein
LVEDVEYIDVICYFKPDERKSHIRITNNSGKRGGIKLLEFSVTRLKIMPLMKFHKCVTVCVGRYINCMHSSDLDHCDGE